jgi:hypothetical protein
MFNDLGKDIKDTWNSVGNWGETQGHNVRDAMFERDYKDFRCSLKKGGEAHQINIQEKGFEVKSETNQSSIDVYLWDDFCGIDFDENLNFKIHTTEFYKGWFSGPDPKYRVLKIVDYGPEEGMDLAKAKKLRNWILTKFNDYNFHTHQCGIKNEDSSSYNHTGEYSWEKKILVFISPASGKGGSQKFYQDVEPTLKASGFVPEVKLTESKDWALNYTRELSSDQLQQYYQVVICGGDGMVNEVINGFYQRGQPGFWSLKSTSRLRIGTLAGGSACGAMTQACKNWGLAGDSVNAMYVLTRSKFYDMSVARFEIETPREPNAESKTGEAGQFQEMTPPEIKTYYGFHSFAFGMSADNIALSEKFRYAGESRYTLGAIQNILFSLPKRKVKISVSETKPDQMPGFGEELTGGNWTHYDCELYEFLAVWYPHFTGKYTITKKVKMESDFGESVVSDTKIGWSGVLKLFDHAEKATLDTYDGVNMNVFRAFRVELNDERYGPKDTWCAIDGDTYPGLKIQMIMDEAVVRQSA